MLPWVLNLLIKFDYQLNQFMKSKTTLTVLLLAGITLALTGMNLPAKKSSHKKSAPLSGHYLFVAVPGIRDYLGYGGHGLLVFDMAHDHQFVKRIEIKGLHPNGKPSNVKGI